VITRQDVEALSTRLKEPRWLTDRRLASFARQAELPVPGRENEEYRRTDLRRLDLGRFRLPADDSRPGRPPRRAVKRARDDAGSLTQVGDRTEYAELSADAAAQGVIFCSLSEAVAKYPDKVRPYFEDARIGADEDKWSALNGALWSGGAFLFVPSGVEVALPLRSSFVHAGIDEALFSRTVVVADAWSSVTYIDDYSSAGDGLTAAALHAGVVDVVAGEGAAIRYNHIQNLGRNVWNFTRERVFARRDSGVNLLQVALGSASTKAFVHAHLDEPGANTELLGVIFASGTQHIDHSTLQNHRVGQTLSDLLFKCALLDRSRSVYSGLIAIHPNAQRSDAYQNNRNLLLSRAVRADSIPMLEILANDVRCTHGSTSSSVDEEELFYLQSRGLARDQAERLIVEGFFANVLERIPLATVRGRLEEAIEAKIAEMGVAA